MADDVILTPNIPAPDDIYEALVLAHDGLSKAESDALNARLILILANHVGEPAVVLQAIEAARETVQTA